jgi:hypothetical protein
MLTSLGGCRPVEERLVSEEWPEPMAQCAEATADSIADIELRRTVLSTASEPLYDLTCLGADRFPDWDREFDWSGDLMCHLRSTNSSAPRTNLLQDDPDATRDWQTRSRFLEKELQGDCGRVPEIGSLRTFRLRGMKLTVRVESTAAGASVLVGVESDRQAVGERAAPVVIGEDLVARCPEAAKQAIGVLPKQPAQRRIPQACVLESRFEHAYPPDGSSLLSEWISDESGAPLFHLRCDAYLASEGGRTVIARWGIDCDLQLPGSQSDLLSLSRDSVTGADRSIFRPEQLTAERVSYPDWGGSRAFVVAGMRLRFEMSEIHFCEGFGVPDLSDGAIDRLTLRVSILPDAHAAGLVPLPAAANDWRTLGE